MYKEFYIPDPSDKRVEDLHQIDCYSWISYTRPSWLVFHPVNEGLIPVQYRAKLLQKGMLKGVPDLVILEPRGVFKGAVIELKRATKAISTPVSDEQKEFLRKAEGKGYFAAVAYGLKSFKAAIEFYDSL